MPAVQGIVGSILTQTLFDSGYKFGFNSDNTVTILPKSANYTQAQDIEVALNDVIKRKPEMVSLLKAGLLYQDADLLKFLKSRADSNGENILAEAQTPEAFLNYLKNTKNPSDAAKAIMSSQNFFENMDLRGHMKAASFVPDMASALKVAMESSQPQQSVTQVAGQSTSANVNNAYSSGTTALYGQTI